MQQVLGIKTPDDGFDKMEKELIKTLGEDSCVCVYSKLPTSRLKAITALHFELGYNQETIADIFKVSQEQISQNIAVIKRILKGGQFQVHRKVEKISLPELIKYVRITTQD
jgi:predicted DNA-binding protein YlxM (UPF0122 family)